ncbi:MAG: phosphate signaling complex protein PhoU [Anaerolineaceae bacterium]|jgi:phosphate transport system protein|nr:phosphate signaling complex protein PhoU [Anaerolineaceae bacterium]MDI9531752.1 phosphate signaling complex protein PhoU [Chloroflexota bacterium]
MSRFTLDQEIKLVQDEMLLLGSLAEQAILNSVDALRRRDVAAAKGINLEDKRINDKRFAIENHILIIFATQSPLAHDLRVLAAMLEIITELERIGDYAKGISKVAIRLADDDTPIPIREISAMADKATSMLHRALGAFVSEDLSAAYAISKEDEEVDEQYRTIYRKVVQNMIKNPEKIDHADQVLWVIHNLERTADRVTNICERIVFVVSGELLELDNTDDEDKEA